MRTKQKLIAYFLSFALLLEMISTTILILRLLNNGEGGI